MKIEIDISEFYLDDDTQLEKGLVEFIKKEAIVAIFNKIKDKVEVEIQQAVENDVLQRLSSEITKAIAGGKIRSREDKNASITISEYVQECLLASSSSSWSNFDKSIKDISKTFCEGIRQRYDLRFASNIVAKLIDNKLIKEDVVKMLLGEKS